MKLQKNERRLAFALITVVAVLSLGAGILKFMEKREQERLEVLDRAEEKKYDQTFSIGDTIILDSKADEDPLPSGYLYEAGLPWDGRMDVTLNRARLYPNDDALLADLDREASWVKYFELSHLDWARKNDIQQRYLLMDVTIRNVSAVTEGLSTSGHRWFSSSFFKLSVKHQDMALAGFNGMPQDGNIEMDMGRFDLQVGETASYQLLFSLNTEAELDEMFCYMGVAYAPNKYRIELDGMEIVSEGE